MIDDLKHDDHEGAMARAELYRAAKYAMKLFQMIDENQELEGWVQSKITKSADYLDSVYHYMEYQMKFAGGGEAEELDDITKDAETDIEDSIADADMSADEEEIKLDETLSYEEKLQALLEGRVKRKCSSKKMESNLNEKAVSKSQQQAAGAALAAKRGDAPKSKLKGASKEMMKMSTKELEKFAGTKHKGLPDKKDKKVSEGSKPDFLDLDKDGNKKEPMKKAAKDAKKKTNEEKKMSVRSKNGKCPPGYNLSKDGNSCIWADITNESIVREGDWYYDHDDPASGSKGAVRKSNTPFWDELIKDVAEKHPEVNTASDFVKFYGVNEIEEVIAKLKKEGEGNNAPRSIKSAKLLRAARDKIAAQIDDSGQEVEEGILDTIGNKIKGYRDSAEAKHKEREAALKVLGNHIKDNSDDQAIVGRLYAVCLGDELECFYSYIVEKGLPITSEIKAIASKFKLKGTANMQVDENNLVKKVVKRVVAEKKAKPDFLDVDKDGNKKEPMKKALKDKEKETVKESAELTRMKQFLTRLNG